MRSTAKDDSARVQTVSGRISGDGSVNSGMSSLGVRARRTTTGQYRVSVDPRPKRYLGGVAFSQAVGVCIYQGELTPGDGAAFITAPGYGQSSTDMTFDFVLQVEY